MTQPAPCLQTVLVVDDDILIRESLRRQLQRAGYGVETAGGGDEALAYAARAAADLVILDLMMPGLSGFETCARMKQRQGWEHVPVLILTGAQEGAEYEAAVEAGADDFLAKPVLFQELLLRIHSLLRIRGYLDDLRESVRTIEAQRQVILRDQTMRARLEAFLLHDLKNPVSSILLESELRVELGTDAEPWGRVLNHAERLLKLVTGWMDFIWSGEVGLHPRLAEVDPRAFLEEQLARHATWLQVRRLGSSARVQEGLRALRMDPVIMERVLGNLLENCIRHTPEGGEIRLEAMLDGDGQARLEISDSGPGIPEDLRNSIFDMYVQLEATSHRVSQRGSRGLGLAFCRMAVEAHGGRIWVEDRPGGGSRFVIAMAQGLPGN